MSGQVNAAGGLMARLLLLPLFITLIVGCGQGQTPDPTPPQVPLVVEVTPDTYAAECGAVMGSSEDIGTGTEGEQDFREWSTRLSEIQTPAELVAFHEARSGQYEAQVSNGGPGLESHLANMNEMAAIESISPGLRRVLLDGGCLDEFDVTVAREFREAQERMKTRLSTGLTLSVVEYARHCRDIRLTTPVMHNTKGIADHYFSEWRKVTPPPIAEDYHRVIVKVYEGFRDTGEINANSPQMLLAKGKAIVAGAKFIETMQDEGCL